MDLDTVKPGSVAFAYIHYYGMVEAFGFSMTRLHIYDARRRNLIEGLARGAGPYHAFNRDRVMRAWREKLDSEWLLTVDTNNEFDPDCLYRLLSVADPETAPMICALYASRPGITEDSTDPPLKWMWYGVNENDEYINISMLEGGPIGHIQRIQNAGMGMVLIHRSVLDRFPEPEPGRDKWFGHDIWKVNGILEELGEDMTFFHRARLAGIPLYGYRGVQLVHWKMRRELVTDISVSERPQVENGNTGIIIPNVH